MRAAEEHRMTRTGKVLLASVALACIAPTTAMAWTKAYVAEWFEPAFRFGGPDGANPDAPGTDCPQGANDIDVKKELQQPFRSPELVAAALNPENGLSIVRTFGFRGPNAENIYENPTSRPDPGFREVAHDMAEGLNLDGDETTGFKQGLNGENGVDNAYYKAAGCVRRWRGPARDSSTGKFHMELMRAGGFTVAFVVSGKGADPMNDEDVTVGIYTSSDRLVKDAEGVIAADYTYRIDPDPRLQSVFKARTRNGVLQEKETIPLLRAHESMQTLNDNPYMELHKARVKFEMKPDGSMVGIMAGYRDWFDLYRDPVGNSGHGKQNGNGNGSGAIAERLGRFNAVGFYYALRRNADGLKDPETGQNRGISAAYRYFLKPAFVVSPQADEAVQVARIFDK